MIYYDKCGIWINKSHLSFVICVAQKIAISLFEMGKTGEKNNFAIGDRKDEFLGLGILSRNSIEITW